jgi:uncharacterized glyoxalase superfamily protein PhnB
MKLTSIAPVLYTRELQKTIDFYQNVFGFDVEAFDETVGWACVRQDSVRIMFSIPNAHVPFEKPVLTGTLYLNTDSVDERWNKVKDKASVVYPIENFDYGMREFCVLDNNGYMIQFGQEIDS